MRAVDTFAPAPRRPLLVGFDIAPAGVRN